MRIFDWITSMWNGESKKNGRDPECVVIPVDAEPVEASDSGVVRESRRRKRTTIFVCPEKKARIEEQIRKSKQETDAVHDAAMGTINEFQATQLRIAIPNPPVPEVPEPREEAAS